jgi:hypothetical protein
VIVAGLTFFPALALGPDRGGLAVMTALLTHSSRRPPSRAEGSGCAARDDAFAGSSLALPEALRKLDPRHVRQGPVVFVVGSVDPCSPRSSRPSTPASSPSASPLWLWLTVLFANLAEAVAEGRGKAQAATLRHPDRDRRPLRLRSPTAPLTRSRCRAPS